jgi:hypothetical protein
MRFAPLFLAATTLFAVTQKPVVTPEPNARFQDLIRHANRCIITTAGSHPNDLKRQRVLLDIEGVAEVARIVELFRFTGEYTSAFPSELDGQEVFVITNCLCTGSHMISFIRDTQELLAMSLHHWTHVRPARVWKSQEINLTKESSDKIRAFLLDSNSREKNPNPRQ